MAKKIKTPKMKYRYFCAACTNVAFYGTEPFKFVDGSRDCAKCGMPQSYQADRWIKL